ncbi:uncharacterized protein BXZ73DRAFT_97546 [Epithele typhae]|uniref:uncharacterized protein n=1 Tax=Epithele typhae TaxID=378194 RepID=UPI002008CDDD|nr:uncharacterized protein BXZ73DRAFT_97546 [Epithele typhae]KAH9943507.1 hypothetical protein BXZ73DRAFT_97546 [Epithele typhae]
MRPFSRLAAWASLLAPVLGAVTWDATPFNPASVPLAVRTPYLSAWLAQGSGTALNDNWPQFWTGSILGWAGFIKVDGTAYSWMGAPSVPGASFNKATQKSLKFTSTQSIFVMSAGPVDLTVTFLSPVEPDDLPTQSIPFSYVALSAAANDGGSHSVQVYADISAEWVTGDNSRTANWTITTGPILTHQVQLASQTVYTESNDHTQYGSAYHSTPNTQGATWQSGEDTVVRAQFINNGKLANSADTQFRAVSDRWPVFAFAHTSYITPNNGRQDRSLLFWTNSLPSLMWYISSFIKDYSNALSRANAFDAKVAADANKISSDYADIVALSIRQTLGACEITISKNADGSFNTNDITTFMKEISSDGNTNTVDVIFPSWPLFLYTNPEIGKQLLLPLFQYQASGQYPNPWAVHDIGAHYPMAIGHNDGQDEAMQVEESGNMLIMTLSYIQKTNDTSLVTSFVKSLLDQWTQFLIEDALIPAEQLSTDDFAGTLANQTNLAIKGSSASRPLQQRGLVGPRYNLYADKLLGTNIFPQSIYELQTAWYSSHANAFGVPLDTRHTYTKSDWEIWTSALVTSTEVRDMLISSVRKYAADGSSSQPLGDWYETTNGAVEGFRARPVVGGHLAHLALQ